MCLVLCVTLRTFTRPKINSDFIKRKVRVRWYADPATGVAQDPAFIEIKEKVGARRFKIRVPLDVAAADLAGNTSMSTLRGLLAPLHRAGHWIEADLQPLLRIAFRRRRFTDPTNGARISIDSTIRGTTVNPALLPVSRPALLAHAVVEVKGESRELSRWMAPCFILVAGANPSLNTSVASRSSPATHGEP